jgi:hypothetical protein
VGDSIPDAAAAYQIDRIQIDPPEVVVARVGVGESEREVRVLRPVADAGDPTQLARALPRPASPGAGIASTGR